MQHDYVCTEWILDPVGPHTPGPASRGYIKIQNVFLQSSSIGISPVKTISWVNVILGILVLCDTTIGSITKVGHLDLYFMVQ